MLISDRASTCPLGDLQLLHSLHGQVAAANKVNKPVSPRSKGRGGSDAKSDSDDENPERATQPPHSK